MNPHEFDKIIDLATSREVSASHFYARLARRAKNRAVQELFDSLAKEELDHQSLLTGLKAEPLLHATFAPSVDYHIAESELRPEISDDMPPRDAVALAMKKEQQAVEFYRGLAKAAKADDVRSLFENLMNMELGHKTKLEALFVDVGFPEVF